MPECDFNSVKTETPIEEIFAWECLKYLDNSVSLDSQVEVITEHGLFRIDFVLSGRNQRVAVECDGHDFHDGFRDESRDAILLGEGHFETIYHFRGCDLTYHAEDCLWLMSILDPSLFSNRGQLNLNQLRKLEIIHSLTGLTNRESYMLRARAGEQLYWFWAFRRNIHHKSSRNPHWPHWRALYEFASEHPAMNLDHLLILWWGKEVSS